MSQDAVEDVFGRALTDLVGDNDHWAARVVAESVRGLSRIAQQKAVYAALGGRMGGELHALQLTTAVPTSAA